MPKFEPEFDDEAHRLKVISICGEDKACQLDFTSTGNEAFAAKTAAEGAAFEETKQLLSMYI